MNATRSPRRILITNNTLIDRAGSEVSTRELAIGLLRRGHRPTAYSSLLGDVARDLERATVPVVSDLGALVAAPDLIHGQHHLDAMCAMLRFPHVPAVYVCHGWLPWEERPPVFPSIRRYVAVDDLCRERLETTPGIPSDRIRTIYNGVDLERFRPRAPLPRTPRTAAVFSNGVSAETAGGAFVTAARAAGIERLDFLGSASSMSVARPEEWLGRYDLVFAKARCALEAMAIGAAVIVADAAGVGGMVTPANVAAMRRLNFGIRTLQAQPLTADTLRREIDRFDAAGSAEVSAFIREHAGAERALDAYEAVHDDALGEPIEWSADAARHACDAASAYVAGLADVLKTRTAAVLAAGEAQRAAARDAQHALAMATARLTALESSTTWRALEPYRRLRSWLRPPV